MGSEHSKNESKGAARDVIVVNPAFPSSENRLSCCDFLVHIFAIKYKMPDSKCAVIHVKVNGNVMNDMQMSLLDERCLFIRASEKSPFRPPSDTLKKLVQYLNPGRNTIQYLVFSKPNNTNPDFVIESHIHLWSSFDSIIVCDIDGTITKSNMHGIIDHSHVHSGICRLFSELVSYSDTLPHSLTNYSKNMQIKLDTDDQDESTKFNNPYSCPSEKHNRNLIDKKATIRYLYLTNRPMSWFGFTKRFLSNLKQVKNHLSKEQHIVQHSKSTNYNESSYFNLPLGALFCQEGRVANALCFEITKRGNVVKHKTLSKQIVAPFEIAGRPLNSNLFIAGFGNAKTDCQAYQSAGINLEDIYMIDEKSDIRCLSWMKHANSSRKISCETQKSKKEQDDSDNDSSFSSIDANQKQNVNDPSFSLEGSMDSVLDICHVSVGESIDISDLNKNFKDKTSTNIFSCSSSKSIESKTSLDMNSFTFASYDDPRLLREIQQKIDVKMCSGNGRENIGMIQSVLS